MTIFLRFRIYFSLMQCMVWPQIISNTTSCPGKISSPNDLYCVEWDVKPYSTNFLFTYLLLYRTGFVDVIGLEYLRRYCPKTVPFSSVTFAYRVRSGCAICCIHDFLVGSACKYANFCVFAFGMFWSQFLSNCSNKLCCKV